MRNWIVSGMIVLGLLVAARVLGPERERPPPEAPGLPIGALFAAADRFDDPPSDWDYRFPADHGAHPGQFGEYWLFAGRLGGADRSVTGFQLAFYRLALGAEPPDNESAWATRQIYRAQLVLDGSRPDAAPAEERYSRAALGLSGADRQSVWLEDWSLTFAPDCGCFTLRAAIDGRRLELSLTPAGTEPVPITGVPGLETDEPGSHGYWWPRLRVQGRVDDEPVTGDAMLEHVWGRRLPVARGQLTLNRLWAVLDDGTALRCLQMRRRGGGGTPLGDCLALSVEGEFHQLHRQALAPLDSTGSGYLLDWSLDWPEASLALELEPLRRQPPRAFILPVWSGLLLGSGERAGQPVEGWAWLELSGY